MNCDERALTFDCAGETLVGVLALPAAPADTGAVIVVGGPQYRAGSHRQFVELARRLAGDGFPVLRFDVRGMGDSGGAQRSFEDLADDIRAAVDAMFASVAGLRRVVLWGLCDGASAALLYVDTTRDPRVAGLGLANPWVRSEVGLARAQVKHYYVRRLLERDFWLKLLRGKVAAGALPALLRAARTAWSGRLEGGSGGDAAGFQQRMARAWKGFGGPILLLLSGRDQTADEFRDRVANDPAWKGALQHKLVDVHALADADHTMSRPAWKDRAESLTLDLLGRCARRAAASPAPR